MSILLAIFAIACSEDDANFNGPYRLNIVGSGEVRPETSGEEYTIGDFTNPGDYTWSVDGPASIAGSATGNTIIVDFQGVGNVTISVTNGSDANGSMTVVVADTEPTVTAILNGTGVLRSGQTDTVFFEFDTPIEGMPTFAVNTDSSGFVNDVAFQSGTLGALQNDNGTFYAIYTAGDGDGTPEALFQDITSTSTYGSVNIDSAFVQLYRVDNIAPSADFEYSTRVVNDSSEVTFTVTFNEDVMAANPAMDSSLLISFYNGGPETGITPETDTLEATEDPHVFTYTYTVYTEDGSAIGPATGNGTLMVEITNVADLAGNAPNAIISSDVVIDNTPPDTDWYADAYNGYVEIGYVMFDPNFNPESGNVYYAIYPSGSLTDPPTAEDVIDPTDAVEMGMREITDNTYTTWNVSLPAGDYDLYLIGKDPAGNWSDIISDSFTVN